MNNGLRILQRRRAVDLDLARQFLDVPVANVSDCMSRMTAGGARLRPMHAGGRMAGPALTIKTRPGDNLMIHKALEVATPGDIIVVSTNGNTTSAIFGELMCRTAVGASLGGIVVDGAIRDIDGITALAFPAYSRAVCAGGCDKDGPGEVNSPISCGNTVVMPGDIIVGDDDGVVVVPREEAADVLPLVNELW